MRIFKRKNPTPLDPATTRGDVQRSETPFLLDVAAFDFDFGFMANVKFWLQRETGEAVPTSSQSHDDDMENHDNNDNINFSTDDSDSDNDGYKKDDQEKTKTRKKWKGKGKGRMGDDKQLKRVEATDMHDEKERKGVEQGGCEALPNLSPILVEDAKNAEENDVRNDKGAKWERMAGKVRRCFKMKEKEEEEEKEEVGNSRTKKMHKKMMIFSGRKKKEVSREDKCVPFPKFSQSFADGSKEVEDDNVESDQEEGAKKEFWYGRPFFSNEREKALEQEQDTCELCSNLDPSTSGNAPGDSVSKLGDNSDSCIVHGERGGKRNMRREERQFNKPTERKKAVSESAAMIGVKTWDGEPLIINDHRMSVSATVPSHGTQEKRMSEPTTRSDPSFHTRTYYSAEKSGQIISCYPATETINVIEAMYVAPPEQAKKSKLGKAVPVLLKRWSWKKDEYGAKQDKKLKDRPKKGTVRTASDESLDSLIEHAKDHLKNDIDDVGQDTHEIMLIANKSGTKNLERQVFEATQSVAKTQTSSIFRSASVKSIVPTIEDNSGKGGCMDMDQRMGYKVERTFRLLEPIPEDGTKDLPHRCQILEPLCESRSLQIPSIGEVIHAQSATTEDTNSFPRDSPTPRPYCEPGSSRTPSTQKPSCKPIFFCMLFIQKMINSQRRTAVENPNETPLDLPVRILPPLPSTIESTDDPSATTKNVPSATTTTENVHPQPNPELNQQESSEGMRRLPRKRPVQQCLRVRLLKCLVRSEDIQALRDLQGYRVTEIGRAF
ncbi:hypothetical protein DSL72_007836 [Monilinia vaccinii-corymbosi]|uniref:Uncharacterized protein n=1 Tax=Monilinia vaccinii-corymbosi TaxID=61207 RepID=A0A8A3PIZ5_9HELO|nr:hypothetical protein DSL72_007836 [Monilinia vaccinii-corymbosi]